MNKRKKIVITTLFSTFVLANVAWVAPKIIALNAAEKNPKTRKQRVKNDHSGQ